MNPRYSIRDTEEHSRRSKLTEEDIPKIRERIANGEMLKTIAADYKVSPTTIGSIRRGYTWSHV
jgi:hypothetical protein